MMQRPIQHIIKTIVWLLLAGISIEDLPAQVTEPTDTVFFLAKKKGLLGRLGRALSVNNPEPVLPGDGVIKNEEMFNPYRGKIIRHVAVQKISFNRSINDTTRVIKNFFTNVGDALHTTTGKKTILNNLFFTPGDTLYPYLLADNERFLRALSFLQDAKIVVKYAAPGSDSVDVIILSKDVFPIGGSIDEVTGKIASYEFNDDNLLGTGNRIQVRNLFDANRHPNYGIGFEVLKRNVLGSFINLAAGYQNQTPAFNSGRREEKNLYLQGELPLVSPYHVWTGAFEIATHFTQNAYVSDSLYRSDFKYKYRVFDVWAGYNIGARRQLEQNFKSRYKRVISLRAIHKNFQDVPDLYKTNYNYNYSDLVSVLSSFTIFEQDFYRTNFLYGFGRNEDIPEGFSLSFISGWSNRNLVSRPYVGFDYQRNYFSNKNNYLNYNIRLGTFFNKGSLEDISMLTSLEYFTKLRKLGRSRWYLRHFLSGSITQLLKTQMNDPLRLSSDYGIPQLNNPDIKASTRISFNGESVFYNTWRFVGFSFAPFVFANVSYLKPIGSLVKNGQIYAAIGGGARTRNENLVFGTMELKAYYYPRTYGTLTMSKWNITFNTDLRFRYISQLIKRPDFAVTN